MTNKHKHAEVIKAWVEGAEIEYLSIGGHWLPASTPTWCVSTEFRVKPKLYKLELELTEAEAFVLACKINSYQVRAWCAPDSMEKFEPTRNLSAIGLDLYSKFDFEAMAATFK